MDDLHTPSVASGPTSGGYTNGIAKDQMSMKELMEEKVRLESELTALSAVLDSHGVNMNTGLTTFDGYPRADIDVAQIRTTRARIIHIRNDYKAVMNRLDLALQSHFAEAATRPAPAAGLISSTAPNSSAPNGSAREVGREEPDIPFARVNTVAVNSPAEMAGLQAGDQIVRFGSAMWLNHDQLRKVSEVVSQNEGRPIAVAVLRGPSGGDRQTLQLILTPRRNWGGRGTLGCHLAPA